MFNFAQTFYIDPGKVNTSVIGLTKIDLYFRAKPKEIDNKSGILGPGVTLSILPTVNGVPLVPEIEVNGTPTTRMEWNEILPSDDAVIPTAFTFSPPVPLVTNREYAILIHFDGDEDFILWSSVQGDNLIGTTTPSPGTSGQYIGNLFAYISPTDSDTDPDGTGLGYSNSAVIDPDDPAVPQTDTNAPPTTTSPDGDYLLTNWKPLSDEDLKFKVWVARYAHFGVPILANTTITNNAAANSFLSSLLIPTVLSNNVIQFPSPGYVKEYIIFDQKSSDFSDLRWGDTVYQNTVSYPGGTSTPLTVSVGFNSTSVLANGSYILADGATFNDSGGFNTIYSGEYDSNEYIIVQNGSNVSVRVVTGIISNTEVTINQPTDFTNSAATFMKAPVGEVVNIQRAQAFGKSENIMILDNSNANTDVRFVNNVIEAITITAGGTGFANSDYIVLSGFENVAAEVEGGYDAIANVVTDGAGIITAVNFSNSGAGFVNTAWLAGSNIVINNSSAQPSSGTGATFTFDVGATLRGDLSTNTLFANCRVVNLQTNRIVPQFGIDNPLGTTYVAKHRTHYYVEDSVNTFSGKVYYINATPSDTDVIVKNFSPHYFAANTRPVLSSRSNEYVIRYPNGNVASSNTVGRSGLSNASVYLFETSSNSDYTTAFISDPLINANFAKYIINNDYTNEHTNYGNAHAKHVTSKVSFNNDRFAEDLLVYLTAYRPVGTDLKVYARVHNSNDPDAFDDKDWSLLEQTDGIGVFSAVDDQSDFVELTYNFPASPNTSSLSGTVDVGNTTTLNVVGAETLFSSELAANDIVKIYPPLFPNNYVIAVVDSITNNTLFAMHKSVANAGLVGAGSIIEKVDFPLQTFNNQLNDNVARYHSSTRVVYDTYDTFQIKVIFLSNNDYIVPKFDDVRSIGVTA